MHIFEDCFFDWNELKILNLFVLELRVRNQNLLSVTNWMLIFNILTIDSCLNESASDPHDITYPVLKIEKERTANLLFVNFKNIVL
jgi:hypothetical protein